MRVLVFLATICLSSVFAETFFDALNKNETAYNELVKTYFTSMDHNGKGYFDSDDLRNRSMFGVKKFMLPFKVEAKNISVAGIDKDGNSENVQNILIRFRR